MPAAGKEPHPQDFYPELIIYRLLLRCFVVVEPKTVTFDPADVGQLNCYLSAVDDLLRHPDDKPSIGLVLCRSRNRIVAEYALIDFTKPIGVARWETMIADSLPAELKASLQFIEELELEMGSGDKRKPTGPCQPAPILTQD